MSIRDLAWGMSGRDVKAVQDALNVQPGLKSPRLDDKGTFGPKTDAKVREFQAINHLKVDGIVGKNTRRALFPVGVVTQSIFAVRGPGLHWPPTDRYSSVMPGKLTPPSLDSPVDLNALTRQVKAATAVVNPEPIRIPGVQQPLIVRLLPEQLLGFPYDHAELVGGTQGTLPGYKGLKENWRERVDAFSVTAQAIYQLGPPDGHNHDLTPGVVVTGPLSGLDGNPSPWTAAGFLQYTDADWFWHFDKLHLVQPYAQIGAQMNLTGPRQPTLTFQAFPINIGLDLSDTFTLQFAAGLNLSLDLTKGDFAWSRQAALGLSMKFGKPRK